MNATKIKTRPSAGATSTLLVLAMVASIVGIAAPAAAAPGETCSELTLVLDESGSISPHEATVRTALHAFLDELANGGVTASVIEFGTAAKTVLGYTPITDATLAGTFDPYIDATAAGDVYDPPSQLGAYTNWDDALDEASQLNATLGVAPLVIFLTDGDPTAYNLDGAGESGAIFVNGVTTEAVTRAVLEAEEVRAQGSHILAVGVGNAVSDPASLARLQQVAGPDVYSGSGTFDLLATDVLLVPGFADLADALVLVAQAMCADPAISVAKSVNLGSVSAGTTVTYQVVVTNTGNVALYDVELEDPAVPGCSATLGTLAVGESVTVTCQLVVWAPLTNTATATGHDPFGTPVEDDDSTPLTLIPTGTGTPGYWRNHPGAWPVLDDEVLVGDWNHNWICDSGETCLPLTYEQALAALTTPPKGDMTWNLARPLVAAWLSASAGNDSSCIAATIDAAVQWLLTRPMGSGVGGDDPSWQEAVSWAEELDDYNNGLLCAESRDSIDGNDEQEPLTATTEAVEAVDEPDDTQGPSDSGLEHGRRTGTGKAAGPKP